MRAWPARVLPIVTILAALGSGCQREPPAVEKALLARLPTTLVPKSVVLSDDGHAYAFVTQTEEGERVVSSVAGTGDPHVECNKLTFAPHSHRLFYWTKDGPKEQPVVSLVVDGAPVATDFVTSGELAFSDDGARWLAASATRGPTEKEIGDIVLFVDGNPLARVRDMALPTFSGDGKHVAYLSATEGRVTAFVDGTAQQTFETPTAPCGVDALAAAPKPDLPLRHIVRYLSDGTLLIVTRDADGWGVYLDGRRIASYPRSTLDHTEGECAETAMIATRSLRIAEQAPAAYWWERLPGPEEVWRVVRNGAPVDDLTCVEPWRRHPPEPSSDGKHLVYACPIKGTRVSQEVLVVRDGVRYGPYDNLWGLAPTKNFAHVAYGAARGTEKLPWAIYVDGTPRVTPVLSVWRPRVSEDGATLAWEMTLDDEGRGFFGVDQRRLGTFDEVLWGPEFESGERVAWVVRRGRTLSRITVPLAFVRAPHHPHRPRPRPSS